MHAVVRAAVMFFAAGASAADSASAVHPVIGAKPPKELKASDILALPELERQAWIHGAVSLMAQALAPYDSKQGSCILGWYFESDGSEVLNLAFETYQDTFATSIVVAAARSACPSGS